MNESYRGDLRRAAALLSHFAARDGEGVRAVLDEAAEHEGGHKRLLMVVCGLWRDCVPAMFTEEGMAELRRMTAQVAADEARDADGTE